MEIQKLQMQKVILFNKYIEKGGKLDGMMEEDYLSIVNKNKLEMLISKYYS